MNTTDAAVSDSARRLETWLGTFADTVESDAYHELYAIHRLLAESSHSVEAPIRMDQDEVDLARDILRRHSRSFADGFSKIHEDDAIRAIVFGLTFRPTVPEIEAAREIQVGGEAKPIGWVLTDNDRCVIDFTNRQDIANGWRTDPRKIVQPVFTHPAAAVGDSAWLALHKVSQKINSFGLDDTASDELEAALAALSAPAHPLRADGVVTDEMGDAALDANSRDLLLGNTFRNSMRAALTAALRADADGGQS